MKKITILLLGLASAALQAQTVAGYNFSEALEAYVSVAGTNSTAIGDDGTQNNLAIGFVFPYGGLDYEAISISTNGFIRLGEAVGGTNWVNELGNDAPQRPLIAPFWDDHNRASGAIRFAVSGTAPNRTLEVGWNNINISGGGGTSITNYGSFKLRLYETTGQIDFIYGPVMNAINFPTASIGINGGADFISVTPASGGASASASAPANAVNSTADLLGRKFTFMPSPQCTSTPVPGDAIATATQACEDVAFTLSLSNPLEDYGLVFQWQSSVNGTDYADIAGATGRELTVIQQQTLFYRTVVSCLSGGSAISGAVQVMLTPSNECYCYPNYDFGKTDGDLISNVVITGTTLANNTGTAPVNPSYSFFQGEPFHTAELQAGATYDIVVTVGTYGAQNVAVWIDYNDDLVFSAEEKVGFTTEEIGSNSSGTFQIQLACDPPAGPHRMRIRDVWNTQGQAIDPCAVYGYGETEDYIVTVLPGEACAPIDAVTIGSVNSSSALVSWESGCGHNSWDVFIGPAGGPAPTSGNYASVTSPLVITGLIPLTDYDIWIIAYCGEGLDSGWAGPFAFATSAMAVANDECSTSFALTPGGSFDDFPLTATNVGASKSIGPPNPTCGTFGFGGDVWFSVVVPESGSITVETRPEPGSSLADTAMSVYSGTCEALTSMGCSDDEGTEAFSILTLTGLDPGQTIYARVWEYANDSFGAFRVSAYHTSLSTSNHSRAAFSIYPNPALDVLHVRGAAGMLTFYNTLGQPVHTAQVTSNDVAIDVSGLAAGVYFVKPELGESLKFIKQ